MEIMHQPTCMMTYGKSFAILAYCRDQASSPPNGGGWERIRRKRCERKRKHDKRAGVHARLKTNPSQPELPSILLSNICSLDNKLNYIRLQRTRQLPAYRPLIRRSKLVLKQVRTWPAGVISALQDCFECTNWDMFREAATNGKTTDLEEYTSSVTSYISKCIDDVTISKSITTHSNQKPWMTAKVHVLLKSRDSAFQAGDKDALRTANCLTPREPMATSRAAVTLREHVARQPVHHQLQASFTCL
ncbi:hypothetical protein QTP70_002468 [Hemibagrus guttatus]|uniref:Uncharacterized protein n=1 Tax=Hemibagrus guttatus TaxID=175788 RepID=A0AAE0QK09_9TELE|nr:hypothetical protein QTP70_002468 [Hemibagrus guttatus]